MESGEVSVEARDLREVDEQESDPPSDDECSVGDPFSVEEMGAEFVFTAPETRNPTPPHDAASQPNSVDDSETRRVAKPSHEVFDGAGEVLSQSSSKYESWKKSSEGTSPYAPFTSQIDYGVAKWAKELGPGDTALSKLLEIPGVVAALGLSWRNARQLNQIIDHNLPHLASWGRLEFKLDGTDRVIECFYRDPLECIESLYGNPAWADVLHVAPERHYTDTTKATRIYNEMNTGNWWWRQQKNLPPGATVVLVVVSSDKTSLKVLSSGKEAYPAYLTIGNIPKSIRRKPSMHAQLLFAYLPTEQFTGTTLSKEQI
ncbi:hypothetical protein FRC01_012960 [Tulasnella sp. 417]|nr:hypothetical protein FRC01_012960 [Tulasnella sp. 417]